AAAGSRCSAGNGASQLTFARPCPYSPAAQPWRACLSSREVRLDFRRRTTRKTNPEGASYVCFHWGSFD
ncbi:MAG: hypothetical protein ACRDL7_01030, partial [Gaiellaceae bacterium]